MAAIGTHGVANKRDDVPKPGDTVHGGGQHGVLLLHNHRRRWRVPRPFGGARPLPAAIWRGGANGAPGRNDTHVCSSGVSW